MQKLKRALLFVWKSGPGWTIAKVVLTFVQGILPLLSLYLTKLLVDEVANAAVSSNKEEAFKQVLLLVVLTAVVNLMTELFGFVANLVNTMQTAVFADYMRGILHAKAIAVDLECYDNAQYYDTLRRAQGEAISQPNRTLNRLLQIGQNCTSLVAIIGLLFTFSWQVGGFLLFAVLPNLLVRLKYASRLYHWERQLTTMDRKAGYFNALLTGRGFAKEIRLFDLGPLFMERYRQLCLQLRQKSLAFNLRRSIANVGAKATAGIVVYGAYGFIAYQTVRGVLTLGDLVMYHQAFQRGRGYLQGVFGSLAGLYENNLYLSNLYELLDLKPKVVDPLIPRTLPCPMRTGIRFNRVSFFYKTSDRKVLEDITLAIKPGEVIALVGENGSGKTTLVKLLCRLYDPTEGFITLDGTDLRQFAVKDLRRQISVIFQDYAKYHLTAQENIWLGNVDCPPDSERVLTAACRSGADEVITRLPQGYGTLLGKLFEGGEELSIGQWQKVALARAFLRDSQLIVLDEPTSALDPKAEYQVFKKFRQLLQGQSAILISHRLSTVRMADCIYVLEKGRIIERGTHDELIRQEGTYAYLFETQARNYR